MLRDSSTDAEEGVGGDGGRSCAVDDRGNTSGFEDDDHGRSIFSLTESSAAETQRSERKLNKKVYYFVWHSRLRSEPEKDSVFLASAWISISPPKDSSRRRILRISNKEVENDVSWTFLKKSSHLLFPFRLGDPLIIDVASGGVLHRPSQKVGSWRR